MSETKQSWVDSLLVYRDIRMLRILLLGAISGFPWVLIASSLSLWLKEEGLSRSTIGWAGLIFGVYAFNYLWAPIIGPNGDFSALPDISKWILTIGMILGRLELFAILVLFLPSFWRN